MDRRRSALNRNDLSNGWRAALAAPPVLIWSLFFALPVGMLLARYTRLASLSEIADDRVLRGVLWFSLWQAVLSTVLTVLVGLGPAYLLSHYRFRGRALLLALVNAAFVLPTIVVGTAFLALLPTSIERGALAVILAHIFFNIAVIVRVVGGVWQQLPDDLSAAARTLGASPWQAFRRIALPLLAPAIVTAASVVFALTFTSFGVVRVLGGPGRSTIEMEIWLRATRLGDIELAGMLSIIQVLAIAAVLLAGQRLRRRVGQHWQLAPVARRLPRRGNERRCVAVGTWVLALALIAPMLALIERSLRATSGYSLSAWRALVTGTVPGQRPAGARPPDVLAAIANSLRFALIATLLSTAVGVCASLAISRARRLGRIADGAMMLPLATSAVTIGFGMLITFDRSPFDWRASPMMIPLGHSLIAIPFVIRTVLPVLRAISAQRRVAAATLGASPLRVLLSIDGRSMLPAVGAGAGFAATLSLGEIGATSLLTRQGRQTVPLAIAELSGRPGAVFHAQGAALAVILAAVTVAVITIVDRLSSQNGLR